MADPKVLAWGVVCGSGPYRGGIHYDKAPALSGTGENQREYLVKVWKWHDEKELSVCGPHRIVALVERPEEGR